MKFEAIKKQIELYAKEGKKCFMTSSFQTHSIVLLHIISRIDKSIPIYFVNTGFLFPETLIYRDTISEQFGLSYKSIQASTPLSQQKDLNGDFYFASDPDYCCKMNKTLPLEPVLANYDVWINGVRADQTAVRKNMKVFQKSKFNCERFHPMLDWTKQDVFRYIKEFDLPSHPLDAQGYMSIGCEPCTRKPIPGDERSARWFGLNKTECGLNTDLAND